MSFEIISTSHFDRELRGIAKKQRSIKKDLLRLIETLEKNPIQGNPLGNDCYKIRIAITSKGKGKSAGARVITHIHVKGKLVYLLSIYDKADKPSISNKELETLLKQIQ